MILVTGGAGFIGSVLVSRLSGRGERVRVLDDFSTGKRERVAELPLVDVFEGDIQDPEAVRSALVGVDRVVHLAAVASVPHAEREPEAATRVNVAGTLVVLGESRRAGVKSLVYASSCSVYGDAGEDAIGETTPQHPISAYAATKLAGERHVLLYHRTGGPPAIALRFFNIYGPGQSLDSPYSGVIVRFAAAALSGGRPHIYGDGEQTRDFLSVADVARAVMRALEAAGGAAGGEVFNIGSGRGTTVNDIWRHVAAAAAVTRSPQFYPPRPGDPRNARARTDKAAEMLGFRTRIELAEGIRDLVSAIARDGTLAAR